MISANQMKNKKSRWDSLLLATKIFIYGEGCVWPHEIYIQIDIAKTTDTGSVAFAVAPGVGFEPTTNGLTVHCSTAELPRKDKKNVRSIRELSCSVKHVQTWLLVSVTITG